MKKLFTPIIAVFILILSVHAYAEIESVTVKTDGGQTQLVLEPYGGGYQVTSAKTELETLTIPSYVEGMKIVKIKRNAVRPYGIKNIVFGDGIEEIDEDCIYSYDYSNIDSITLPDKLKELNDFGKRCRLIVKDTSESFTGVDGAIYSKDKKRLLYCQPSVTACEVAEGTEVIAENAFYGDIRSVTLPQSLKKIEHRAFYNAAAENIIIPDSVTEIGDKAFEGCLYIKLLSFGRGITKIPDSAVYKCKAEKIYIPDTVTEIGEYSFSGTAIGEIELPAGLKKIGARAFASADITDISLPDGLSEIGDAAFASCTFKDMTIPQSVNTYGTAIFWLCKNLQTVQLPDNITEIPDDMFYDCDNLKTVKIPEGVRRIGAEAFQYSGIEEITLPSSLEEIGAGGFQGTDIENIDIPDSVNKIGEAAFDYCKKLKGIAIPEGVTTIEPDTFDLCEALETVKLPASLTKISYNAFRGSGIRDINLPDSVAEIGACAFEQCENLKQVKLPASLEIIGASAFYESAIEAVTIPSSVTFIGNQTFANCYNLNSLTIENGVNTIPPMFAAYTPLQSVKIPDSVEMIGSGAFYGCSGLEEIYLPENCSLEKEGYNPFFRCDEMTVYTDNQSLEINNTIRPAAEFGSRKYGDKVAEFISAPSAVRIGNEYTGTYLPAYMVNSGSVYIIAEDLAQCGYSVNYDHNAHILYIDGNATQSGNEPIHGDGGYAGDIVKSDIKTYLNGKLVPSLSMDGLMLIPAEYLSYDYHIKRNSPYNFGSLYEYDTNTLYLYAR